jgi:aminobenzoyl-glutamate utilization protein B
MAMTALDFFLDAAKVEAAWKYFREEQTKDVKYVPLIRETDTPATHLNREIMAKYREEMKKYYYDPTKYGSYLEQLGIQYPTVRPK